MAPEPAATTQPTGPAGSERIVDSHTHAAADDRARYPRGQVGVPRSPWWEQDGHGADALLQSLGSTGVARAVLVQAVGLYGFDNRYLLDVIAAPTGPLVGVPAVDVGRPGAVDEITRLGRVRGVVGIRLFAVSGDRSWVGTPTTEAVLRAADRAGLVVVLTAFGVQLEALRPALDACREASVTVDHCAFPELRRGRLRSDDPVFALRAMDNVNLKVTSLVLRAVERAGADPAALVDQLADSFGADRLLWGSDHPQTDLGDYRHHVELARHAVRRLPRPAALGVLGSNTGRVFGLARGRRQPPAG